MPIMWIETRFCGILFWLNFFYLTNYLWLNDYVEELDKTYMLKERTNQLLCFKFAAPDHYFHETIDPLFPALFKLRF